MPGAEALGDPEDEQPHDDDGEQRLDRTAPVPGDLDLLGGVNQLADAIVELDATGQISQGRAQSLLSKLAKAQRALEPAQTAGASDADVAAQQSFLGDLGKALKALTDFLRELTTLVTELPADVVQPIINAVLDLINGIVGLLVG